MPGHFRSIEDHVSKGEGTLKLVRAGKLPAPPFENTAVSSLTSAIRRSKY